MSRVAIDLGIIKIYWYSIMIFIAMIVGSYLVLKEAKRKSVEEDTIVNLIFYSIIIGILGARTYYVLFNLNYYLSNPVEIIEIWNGGLAIHGGLIAALVFIYFYTKKNNIEIIKILDISVVGVIIAQSIGRWGNFFNQEAYGMITTKKSLMNMHLPKFIIDRMYIEGYYRQPTFLYESIWNLIGFIILLLVRSKKRNLKKGQLTAIYLIWYGIGRFIVESMRTDSLMFINLKIAQIVSLIFVIVGLYLIIRYRNKKEDKYYY